MATVNVTDYASFQEAVDALPVEGGIVHVPAGDYQLCAVAMRAGVTLRGEGMGATRLHQAGPTAAMITAQGTLAPLASPTALLAADANPGATSLTLTDTSGIAPGDVLLLGDNTPTAPIAYPTRLNGELVRVRAIDSTTVARIWGAVRGTYTTAQIGGGHRLGMVQGVAVQDLAIIGNPGTSTTKALSFQVCRDVSISNVRIEGMDGPGIELIHVLGCHVSGCQIRDLSDDAVAGRFGYGVNIGGASEDIRVEACGFARLRHAVTTNGSMNRGMPRRITVDGCTATETTSAAFDTHEAGEDILFSDCHVNGCQSDGFLARANRTRFIGCTVHRISGVGFVTDGELAADVEIRGCSVSYAKHGVEVRDLNHVLTVQGCHFDRLDTTGVQVSAAATRATIVDNAITNVGQSATQGNGVHLLAGSGHLVAGNKCHRQAGTSGTYRYAVALSASTSDCKVWGNTGGGLSKGLIDDKGTGNVVTGNVLL